MTAGIDVADLRETVERHLEDGDSTIQEPPFNTAASHVRVAAYEEAAALEERLYDTDHLLLGLASEQRVQCRPFVFSLGHEFERLRQTAFSIRKGEALGPGSTPPWTEAYAWNRCSEAARQTLFDANDQVHLGEAIHLLHRLHTLLRDNDVRVHQVLRELGASAGEVCYEIERQRAWSGEGADLFLSPTAHKLGEWASR